MKIAIAAAFGLLLSATSAQAAAIFTFQEDSGNVVGTLSGSLDISGMAFVDTISTVSGINASIAVVSVGGSLARYAGLTGPGAFGSGTLTLGVSSSSGDVFWINGASGMIALPVGYLSGDALNSTLTFTGASFGSLGVNPGDYGYTLASQDTLTIRFGPAEVPVPATLPLFLTGLIGLGFAAGRRCKPVARN